MKKRVLSLALSLIMALTMLPVTVWAEMDESMSVVTVEAAYPAVTAPEDGDSDALLLGYLYEQAGLTEQDAPVADDRYHASSPAMMAVARGDALTGLTQTAYTAIREMAAKVAEGSADRATFTLTDTASYTAEQAGVDAFTGSNVANAAVAAYEKEGRLDKNALQSAMLSDMPYDLYWYDKTRGFAYQIQFGFSYSPTNVDLTVTYTFYFTVADSYASGTVNGYQVVANTAKTGAAKQAAVTARSVVDSHRNEQDAEKLRSYLTYVDNQTSYNHAAAADASTPYGDPWQLIWVFDGDSATTVVCEGYAKAFKFLCDLTENWSDPDFDCYLVTGTMNGGTGEGAHMWNVVHLANGNYLVDATNCDEGTIGASDRLFMRQWESGVYDRTYSFTNPTISFTYDDETKATFKPEELMLKGDPALPAAFTLHVNATGGSGTITATVGDSILQCDASGNLSFETAGTYTLTLTRSGCVTRTVTVTFADGDTVKDVTLSAIGDLNGAEGGNIGDMDCLFAYLFRGEYIGKLSNDETYFRAVADVNGDGVVNILDYQALYEIVKA